jgi:hypothetical protein
MITVLRLAAALVPLSLLRLRPGGHPDGPGTKCETPESVLEGGTEMEGVVLEHLTEQEMQGIEGGLERYTCAMLGGLTAAAFIAGQWWAVTGGLIAAYNGGCFQT